MPPPPSRQPVRRAPEGASSRGVPARRPTRAPQPQAKLVVQAGPATGQQFVLDGDEVVLGRAADNAVSIPDTAVSRKHAVVRRVGEGWAVSDLGSGNGTLLNGETIVDETTLSEGDVITIGDSELQFSDGGVRAVGRASRTAEDEREPEAGADTAEAQADPQDQGDPEDQGQPEDQGLPAPPVPRSRGSGLARAPVRTARNGGGAIERAGRRPVRTSRMADDPAAKAKKRRRVLLTVLATAFVAVALLVGWKAIAKKRAAQALLEQSARREHQEDMADRFKDAKNLVRAGRWEEARAKLVEIAEADPDYEPRQIENYLKRADEEIPNQRLLAQAQTAISESRLGDARVALAKIRVTTQETAVSETRDLLDTKTGEKLAEARQLIAFATDLAKMEKLKALSEDVLAVRDGDREASELKKQAEAAIERIKNPAIAPIAPETPWLEVQQRYRNGDASGALSLAQACANKKPQCRTLENQIKEFDTKSKRLEELGENELISLYDLDKKIAGGASSELSRPLRTQLISKLYVKASQARTTGNWPRAIEYSRRVLSADPQHVGALALVNEARSQAKEVYLRGYQLVQTSPDEAIRLFKDVMNMTPPDDEYHQKAKSRITEMQRQ